MGSQGGGKDIGEGRMNKTKLTENMLRIYEGLKKEQKLEFIIESLINDNEEKPYRSEVEDDPIAQAKRQEEFNN